VSAPDVTRFSRRVLVCQGEICRARGAGAVLAAWLHRAAAVDAIVLGPVVVVYPEGSWLGGQTPRRVAETIRLGCAGHWDLCPGLIPAIE
jgi:hypothetical protein